MNEIFVVEYQAGDGQWLLANAIDGGPFIFFEASAAERFMSELDPQGADMRVRSFRHHAVVASNVEQPLVFAIDPNFSDGSN